MKTAISRERRHFEFHLLRARSTIANGDERHRSDKAPILLDPRRFLSSPLRRRLLSWPGKVGCLENVKETSTIDVGRGTRTESSVSPSGSYVCSTRFDYSPGRRRVQDRYEWQDGISESESRSKFSNNSLLSSLRNEIRS